MTQSILDTIKGVLGLDAEYDVFNADVILHVNSIFANLRSMGVGPDDPFFITGPDEVWADFMTNVHELNNIKSYIYIKVRLLFDPPASSVIVNALQEQAKEFEWRIHIEEEVNDE